jgi:hypothetical protein
MLPAQREAGAEAEEAAVAQVFPAVGAMEEMLRQLLLQEIQVPQQQRTVVRAEAEVAAEASIPAVNSAGPEDRAAPES